MLAVWIRHASQGVPYHFYRNRFRNDIDVVAVFSVREQVAIIVKVVRETGRRGSNT